MASPRRVCVGGLSDPRIKPGSPELQMDSLPSEPPGKPLSPFISCFQEQVKALLGRKQALGPSH